MREVVPEDIMALKAQPGGDMVVGGANLAATFMRYDLIDEYRLYMHPVVVGRGRPPFQPSDTKVELRLAGTRSFGNGVVLLRYERADDSGGERLAHQLLGTRPQRRGRSGSSAYANTPPSAARIVGEPGDVAVLAVAAADRVGVGDEPGPHARRRALRDRLPHRLLPARAAATARRASPRSGGGRAR